MLSKFNVWLQKKNGLSSSHVHKMSMQMNNLFVIYRIDPTFFIINLQKEELHLEHQKSLLQSSWICILFIILLVMVRHICKCYGKDPWKVLQMWKIPYHQSQKNTSYTKYKIK